MHNHNPRYAASAPSPVGMLTEHHETNGSLSVPIPRPSADEILRGSP